MIENVIALLLTLILATFAMTLFYVLLEDEIKEFFKKHKGALEDMHKLLTPKTPIQKEIEAELKEIEQLEKQKEDMDKLKELKARKERLFAEVSPDYEESTGPHFKWCAVCKNYYSGERCDCSDKKVNAVDPSADRPYKLIYNGYEVPFRFRTEQEAHKYAKAISKSDWFIAEVERIDV